MSPFRLLLERHYDKYGNFDALKFENWNGEYYRNVREVAAKVIADRSTRSAPDPIIPYQDEQMGSEA
jgi:hypothetical protein